jgi:hypothetical protein
MATTPIEVTCMHCCLHQSTRTKTSFLGFRRFICSRCHQRNDLPLLTFTRLFYWIVLVFVAMAIVNLWASGRVAFPGLLILAAAWALIVDRKLRAKQKLLAEP